MPSSGARVCPATGEEDCPSALLPKYRAYTVAQIAAEFGVIRPTIYRHLQAAN